MGECGFDVKEKDIVTLCCCLAECGPECIEGGFILVPDMRIKAFTGGIKFSIIFKPKNKG